MRIENNKLYANDREEAIYFIFECDVKTTYGSKLKWGTAVVTIVEVEKRFFEIEWVEAATSSQEHEINLGPYPEVIKRNKIIEIEVWEKVENFESFVIKCLQEKKVADVGDLDIVTFRKLLIELKKYGYVL